VNAVITMGKSLKHRVIAEGVETEEQLTFLQAHRCDEDKASISVRLWLRAVRRIACRGYFIRGGPPRKRRPIQVATSPNKLSWPFKGMVNRRRAGRCADGAHDRRLAAKPAVSRRKNPNVQAPSAISLICVRRACSLRVQRATTL